MNLKIKKNPLARVAFRIFALCLCLLASTAHTTAQEVVYELVTDESQLVAGEKCIFVDMNNKIAMCWRDSINPNRSLGFPDVVRQEEILYLFPYRKNCRVFSDLAR